MSSIALSLPSLRPTRDQNERDHAALLDAIAAGRIRAQTEP